MVPISNNIVLGCLSIGVVSRSIAETVTVSSIRRIVTMSSEKFLVFNGVADELRPWILSIEVGTIKRNGETFGALRRTSMEVYSHMQR